MVTQNSSNYSPTNHAVQVGGASGTLTSVTVGASNSICQGVSASDPTFTTTPRLVGLGIGAASTGSGLTFDGSSTLANFVDKTSFTPGIAFGGGTTGITYTNQSGFYTRIGNCVFFSLNIVLSNKGSSTGTMTFTGLPITSATATVVAACDTSTVTFTGNNLVASIASGGTVGNIGIVTTALGVTNLADTAFANTSAVRIAGFYYV